MALQAISISLRNGELPKAALGRARVELDQKEVWIFLQHSSLTTRLCSALEGSRRAPKMLRLLGSSRTQDLAEKTLWKSSGFPSLRYMGIGILRKESTCIPLCRGYATGRRMSVRSSLGFARKAMPQIAHCTSQWNYRDKAFLELAEAGDDSTVLLKSPRQLDRNSQCRTTRRTWIAREISLQSCISRLDW